MNCEQVELLLPEYWSGAIAMNDHRELEKHFASCPACKLQAEQLGGVWKRLDMADVSGVAPSESLRERFYETLDAYRAGVEAGTSSEKALGVAKSTLAWWRQPWFQFATAAAMLLVGVFAGRSVNSGPAPVPANDQIAQLRGEVSSMRQLVALSLLQQQSASDRLRGVSYAYRVEKNDTEVVSALLATVNSDPNVNVRLSAVDALKSFGASAVVRKGLVQAIAKQTSPMVQIGLINALVDMNDRASIGQLKQIQANAGYSAEVRQHAEWAGKQLERE